MARIKATEQNIKSLLAKWVQGQNLTDELVFLNNSINTSEWISQAWNLGNVIVEVLPDVGGFSKFVFKEKL